MAGASNAQRFVCSVTAIQSNSVKAVAIFRREWQLKAAFLLVLPTLLCLATEASARSCHIQRFTFNYTGSGPWPAHMRVQSGKSCGSRSWSTGGIFKGLYLTSGARHGRVTLVFPGTYRYFPSPGYVVTTDLL